MRVELRWWEGQAWIESALYAGPQDLFLVLAQRETLDWSQLSTQEAFAAAQQLLPSLPLEERMELLVFLAHLLRLKAFALLPLPLVEEESLHPSPNGKHAAASYKAMAQLWEGRIQQQSYRLPRGSFEKIGVEPALVGLTQMRLFQAYKSMLERLQKRLAVHSPEPLPFSPEAVAQELETFFARSARWSLSALWDRLRPEALYRAVAFLWLLVWIQEQRLAIQQQSVCEVWLMWQG